MPEVNVTAFKDKYYDYSTFTGYGNNTTLLIGSKTSFNNGRYWVNMAFDLSSIPANKKITAAQLYVYVAIISGSGVKNLYAMCSGNFNETSDGISYSPLGLTNILLDTQGQYYPIDITTIAQRGYTEGICNLALGPAENLDIVIPGDVPTYTVNARENGSNKPYIVITYEDLPPNPPTNLSPSSETKLNNEVIRFSWTHNPTQTGDTQSKFDLLWSSNGGSTWNTITQTTANQYYDMPADTLPVGSIIWKVRTYANSGLVSEYSSQAAFTSAGKPVAPVLTKPDATENTSTPLILWTATGQVMYQAQVLQGASVAWDSGEVASTVGQVQVGVNLADNTSYTAKVRIKNQYDLWSDWATKAFTVDFELPNKPSFDIVKDLIRASIRLTITNPLPDGAGGFQYNEIYRRKVNGAWMKIASNIERNGTYEDCAMASSQPYEYMIRTIGTFGYMDSDVKYADIRVRNSQLASISDKGAYVPLIYDPKRNISLGMSRTLMQFAGREKPVSEFSEHTDLGITLSFVIKDIEDIDTLMALVESAETLLYRDNRGRKIYCTIGSLGIDEERKYWTVSFAIAEVSHQEGV